MSEAGPHSDGGAPLPGWRQRHPVFARALLYGAGAVLAAGALYLLVQRQGVDRRDRADFHAARIDMIEGIQYPQDPIGDQTLEALAADLSDADVAPGIALRVVRLQGLVHARAKRSEEAERAFAKAEALAHDPRERGAVVLEWATARQVLGDHEGARALLARPEVPTDGAIGILAATGRALAEEQAGRPEAAARILTTTLAGLPTPLPDGPEERVNTRLWTPAAAALEATVYASRLVTPPDPGLWRRLVLLAPHELEALLVASQALAEQGFADDARRALNAARRLDPPAAEKRASRIPALRQLALPPGG